MQAESTTATVQEGTSTQGQDKAHSLKRQSSEHALSKEKADSTEEGTAVLDGHDEKKRDVNADVERGAAGASAPDDDESHYVDGYKLFLIFIGMLMSIFLVALDQTIVATAIPKIASDFQALQQVTWIASGYFLTQAGLILSYGRILAVAPTKWVYLVAVMLFELGSVICGAAPNINVLIFGRALAGTGAAGIFTSCLSIIARITRLEQRPLLFGAFGGIFALASVVGPLLGGAFTQHVSWRWCFYINLPFGAVTIASILLFIKREHSIIPVDDGTTWWQKAISLDWVGSILCVGMVTSLLLPLQWGGVTKPWTDKTVIALFVVFAVLFVAFIAWEHHMGIRANLPLDLFKRRTQIGCCLEAFFLFLILLLSTYYLPLYYQSSAQHTATQSGIDILTYMICTVFGALLAGIIIKQTGRPKPFLVLSPLIAAVGAGVVFRELTSSKPSTSHLIGFQVLLGLGVGGAFQNTIIAIQAEYHDNPRMVPQSTSLVNFTQLSGGIIGIAVAGTIFGNRLGVSLEKFAPNLSPEVALMVKSSVTTIATLSGDDKANVIKAYSEALGYVFILGIPAGLLASASALLIKNFDLRKMQLEGGGEPAIA
ncbi:hypothetical protein FRB95_002402 [Tulasnella sp. JGI-2019a]|nr:hypothetical protein FRB95_002402 [Tulasnella sp. JGI-2019a]